MISADLTGKAILVTGGASGIGLAAAELFARSGAKVAINHLQADERGRSETDRLSGEGLAVISAPGDVSDPADAERMVNDAVSRLGRLDGLINNAGTTLTTAPIPFDDLDAMGEEFWSTMLSTNLVGPFRCARAAAPALREARGAIVNTASVAGLGLRGSSIAYAASKAGLINLTRSLARALAPEVRVNAVAPGWVDPPLPRAWRDSRKQMPLARTLLARRAQPADIAEAMLFLVAGAGYMTGQTLVLDGGAV